MFFKILKKQRLNINSFPELNEFILSLYNFNPPKQLTQEIVKQSLILNDPKINHIIQNYDMFRYNYHLGCICVQDKIKFTKSFIATCESF